MTGEERGDGGRGMGRWLARNGEMTGEAWGDGWRVPRYAGHDDLAPEGLQA